MTHTKDTFLVVGNAKTTSDNPITHQWTSFFVSFLVHADDGRILDAEASVILPLSKRFIRDLFVDGSLAAEDQDLIADIQRRYHGSSRKALVVAYKDAVKKYRQALTAWNASAG
ncbi:MAG: DUF3870 domain-containing protein [Desulfosarcinaceae bacterium]|nr:DUF3870 domain-containing protein [Desulfosarcinaceae bacterium]